MILSDLGYRDNLLKWQSDFWVTSIKSLVTVKLTSFIFGHNGNFANLILHKKIINVYAFIYKILMVNVHPEIYFVNTTLIGMVN